MPFVISVHISLSLPATLLSLSSFILPSLSHLSRSSISVTSFSLAISLSLYLSVYPYTLLSLSFLLFYPPPPILTHLFFFYTISLSLLSIGVSDYFCKADTQQCLLFFYLLFLFFPPLPLCIIPKQEYGKKKANKFFPKFQITLRCKQSQTYTTHTHLYMNTCQ